MPENVENEKTGPESFRHELAEAWRALPHKGFFFGLVAAWVALFQLLGNSTFGYADTASLFGWLCNAYTAPESEDSHGLLVPLVVLGLLWWKRRELSPLKKDLWWPALFGLAIGLGLHTVGYVIQQPRLSVIGFLLGLYALTGLAWGTAWLRATFFPFVLLAFCIPIGTLAESITFPLRRLVTFISVHLSQQVLGIDVIRDGTRLFDAQHTFQYDVAPACSGIRSLITLVALNTIYGFVTFRRAWKRGVVIALAVPLAVVGNVVRIVGVIITAETFGQTAGARFHDGAGFVTFAIAVGCILLLGHWLREDRLITPPLGKPV